MKRFLLFVAVATLFAACSKDGVNEISNDRGHAIPSVLYASIDTEDETRMQLDELQKTVWTEGDLVSVFYYCNGNTPFEFKGKTGDRDGRLGVLSLVEGDAEIDKIVSIYPYSEEYTMNTTKKYVSVKLPATQHYLEGSYGVGDNLMAYVGDDDSNLSHKNLCGWIKIQLKGSGIVTKITLKGNDGEQLAGDAKFYYEDFRLETLDQGGLAIGEYIETITLDCGKGVTLDAETPTEFYFVVAPHTFAKGITVDITAVDGSAMTKTTDNEVVIERNHIKPMSAFGYNGVFKPANNEIWYTNGSTTAPTAPDTPAAFGDATIQSNTYDVEKDCWVITFDKDVTTIGKYAFFDCDRLTSVTIPDSVTTIGGGAFQYCDSLTSVTIPDSVTTIGGSAFRYCDSLTSVTIPDSVTTIGVLAFNSCKSLTSVTIGDSVTTIGEGAFEGCESLKEFKGKFAADGGRCLIIDGVLNAFAIGCGATQYTIPDSVTTIGYGAFSDCYSLTSVTIPDSVTTIGDYAFFACTSLTSVTIPDSVTTIGDWAFAGCDRLTSVTIPDSVKTIGDYAFYDCDCLKTVYCKPTTPPTGGRYMFDDNAYGRKIYVPASDDDSIINAYKAKYRWSDYASNIFEDEPKPANNEIWYTNGSTTELTSPNKADAFGDATIHSNTYDAEKKCWVITFDKDVTEIGESAFYGYHTNCNKLTSVTIPDSVKTIGDSAFAWCESLTSVTIPDSVTTIGELAFCACYKLTSVTIPDSVTTIGVGAFEGCDSLKEFKGKFAADGGRCLIIDNTIIAYANASGTTYTIPDSVTTIGYEAFRNCTSLTSVTIPDSVKTIGYEAFYGCESLTSVTIPDSVTTIGDYAFHSCTSLTSVTIPDSITTIGDHAFAECDSLTSVTIPESVTTIKQEAFAWCTSLATVYCKPTTPPTGGYDMFSYYDGWSKPIGCKIYVPASADDSIIKAYKAKQYWRDYADYIFEDASL